MDAYHHFGLARPPFDPFPDATCFHDAPTHAEALATLEYTVRAAKGCCVVVGDAGSGKTLLARMVARSATAATPVFWIRGCGQPVDETRVSIFPTGRFGHVTDNAAVEESTLEAETRVARFRTNPPLLIVDCADELPGDGWRDVRAWISDETRYPRALTVLLFGLPRLLSILATPDLVCLQRRVFRACRLEALSADATANYIRSRIAAAGGDLQRLFDEEAVSAVARHAQGNPALINRLCDNALLEAYGEGRNHVVIDDVHNAMQASFGERLREQTRLPLPTYSPFIASALLPPPMASHSQLAAVVEAPGSAQGQHDGLPAADGDDPVETRLRQFATRLSRTLQVVRDTCNQRGGAKRALPAAEDSHVVPSETRAVEGPSSGEMADDTTTCEIGAQPVE